MYISDLRGGRNGVDNAIDPQFPMTQCVEAMNVDWYKCAVAAKRGGSTSLSTAGGTAFSGTIQALLRHLPTGEESLAEMWGFDTAGVVKRMAGGTAFANVTLADAISGLTQEIIGVTFNGKLFLFYDSAVDRLHVWDGSTVRRVGINPGTTAPTVANTGGGAYPAVLRYYRVRFLHISGGLVVRRSEPTPSVSFTPSGAGTAARVTRPTAPGEGETDWEAEGSTDNITFYQLAGWDQAATQIAIGTTTYDDSILTGAYSARAISPTLGKFSFPTSCRFGITDGNRMLMAGTFEAGKTSRIFFGPVLGTSDQGDDERVPQFATPKNYLDINEKDGGKITALAGPVNSVCWAMKFRHLYRLTPTGDLDTPYTARKISDVVGSINQKSVVMAEDASGNPAIYFISAKGFQRLSVNGLEYMGRDVEDHWYGLNGKTKVNLSATTVSGHGVYHPDKRQIWWFLSKGSGNTPDTKFVLDIKQAVRVDRYGVRGGWCVHDGASAAAVCSVMFSNTPGASMSIDLKPYVGLSASATILKCDTSDLSDNGTPYKGYIKTRSIVPSEMVGLKKFQIGESVIVCEGQAGVTIYQTIDRDFGAEVGPDVPIPLDPEGTEDHCIRKAGGSMQSDGKVFQVQYGDIVAAAVGWSIDLVMIPLTEIGDF